MHATELILLEILPGMGIHAPRESYFLMRATRRLACGD
jgi:hypothetical protein